mgnify:CR=1 FL=1
MKYKVIYSNNWEGFKNFRKFSSLLRMLNKIPEYELKYTRTYKTEDGIPYVGAYFIKKSGELSVRF